jgi:hypothetical protein
MIILFINDVIVSDAALKEYLVWLDKQVNSVHFIISELDSTHLFITYSSDIADWLQLKLDEWLDRNSFSIESIDQQLIESGGEAPGLPTL